MPSLASPEDLHEFPGVSSSLPDVDAWAALGRAERALIAELGWPLWEHTGSVIARGSTEVLPALHVTAVSVTAGGVVQASTWATWKPNGIVELPWVWRLMSVDVVITYTAGFTALTMPKALKDVCVELAASGVSGQASNLKSWTGEGGVSATYDLSVDSGYSLASDRRLDPFRVTAAVA